jgi:putative transport protein
MFLYGIGILYGRQFFEGMVGAGQKYNLLALVACLAGLGVAPCWGSCSTSRSGTHSAFTRGR